MVVEVFSWNRYDTAGDVTFKVIDDGAEPLMSNGLSTNQPRF